MCHPLGVTSKHREHDSSAQGPSPGNGGGSPVCAGPSAGQLVVLVAALTLLDTLVKLAIVWLT
jgi:hypothetical protein